MEKMSTIEEKNSNSDDIISKYSTEQNIKHINKIITIFRINSFRKKVKHLIMLNKKNFVLPTTLKEKGLKLVALFPDDKVKEYPVMYNPILKQRDAYVLRDDFKKRLLLKCYFVNKKNESIIDPKYNNEFDDGIFVNVISLKKIIEKEEEREDDFQTFLEKMYTGDHNFSKELNEYFFGRTEKIKRTKKRTLTASSSLKLKGKFESILKERPIKRVPSTKKISFGQVTKLEYYVEHK